MTYSAAQQGTTGYDFLHDLFIVENEIKGFIAQLYKFFYKLEDCDWRLAAEQLREIDLKTASLLDDIDQRQLVLFMMDPGSFPDVDTNEFMQAIEISSSQEVSEGFASRNSTSSSANKTYLKSSKTKKFLRNLNKSNGRSYTFGVVESDIEEAEAAFENLYRQTGTNLYRAKNYENLHGLFDFE